MAEYMKKPDKRNLQSNYIRYDAASGVIEHSAGVQVGDSCRVDELKDIFAWMRGFVYGWYGWANDGKGTFLDFMQVLKAKYDGIKVCTYRQEDMDSIMIDNKPEIRANRIYKNLAWSFTGKTWIKSFAQRNKCLQMSIEEEMDALSFITKHFFVVYPQDRQFSSIMDNFMFMYEKYGCTHFNIDPWNTVKLPSGDRGDQILVDAFIDIKEFAMRTNSVFNIVNHPKTSGFDVKVSKAKDSPYKHVTSYMQLGGTAWNMKMDVEASVFRHERHLDMRSRKVTFFNLKTRQAEVVGVDKGEYELIEFDRLRKQYYFDGICPMDGSMLQWKKDIYEARMKQTTIFSEPTKKEEPPPPAAGTMNDLPF